MKELTSVLLGVIVLGMAFNYFYTVRKLPDKLDAANK